MMSSIGHLSPLAHERDRVLGRPLLEVRNLSKVYGKARAVDDVSAAFEKGTMAAVVGPSGAGKTTLLRMLNRLVEPTEGDIIWEGENVARLKHKPLRAWRRRAAMIFQQFQLVPRLDVVTNVLIGSLHDRPLLPSLVKSFPKALRARAILELDALGIAQLALRRAGTLSGGQQQRVAIARAMMQRPELVLADEPVASLDPANADIVMEALARINRERGITVLVNLHSLDLVHRFCPQVIGMAAGRIVFDGRASDLDAETVNRIYGSRGSTPLEGAS